MLFTIFSVLALAALGQSAPASAELEERSLKSKYHCVTKYSGKLTGGEGEDLHWTPSDKD